MLAIAHASSSAGAWPRKEAHVHELDVDMCEEAYYASKGSPRVLSAAIIFAAGIRFELIKSQLLPEFG